MPNPAIEPSLLMATLGERLRRGDIEGAAETVRDLRRIGLNVRVGFAAEPSYAKSDSAKPATGRAVPHE